MLLNERYKSQQFFDAILVAGCASLYHVVNTYLSRFMQSLSDFFTTAPGLQLRRWESAQMDSFLSKTTGDCALQLGAPYGAVLRNAPQPVKLLGLGAKERLSKPAPLPNSLLDFSALPFREASFDLIVSVHAMERTDDATQFFSEVFRVLAPEGRLVLLGLNPWGPWWLRKKESFQRFGLFKPLTIAQIKKCVAPYALIDRGRFGVYCPSFSDDPHRLARWGWCEKAGDRWWPAMANGFMLSAVKKEEGFRLIGKLEKAGELLTKGWQQAPVATQCEEADDVSKAQV